MSPPNNAVTLEIANYFDYVTRWRAFRDWVQFSRTTQRGRRALALAKRHSSGSHAALTTVASEQHATLNVTQRRDEFALPQKFASNKQGLQSPTSTSSEAVVKNANSSQCKCDPVLEVGEAVEEEQSGDRCTSGGQFTKPKHYILHYLSEICPLCVNFFHF